MQNNQLIIKFIKNMLKKNSLKIIRIFKKFINYKN